jgi:hypothetical protein
VGQVGRWGSRVPAFTSLEKYRGTVQHGNKIRELIYAQPFTYEGQEIHRTMSFLGSAYSEDTNIEKTIDQADQRLYSVKNFGRKKVVWEDAYTKSILMQQVRKKFCQCLSRDLGLRAKR